MLNENTILNQRYQILRVLSNKGGMGVIYQATDLSFNNTVVIKHSRFTEQFLKEKNPALPPDQLRSHAEYLRKAFEREAKLLRGLKHLALPTVIDYFNTGDGHQFFVMDFIPGQDFGELLDERLRQNRGPLPLNQVLDWADQLLDALDYLHTRFESPIIHRDLKPLNLKLTPDGRIVLLDFGLAKGATPGMSVVSASIHGYTLQYAPLEQIRGKGTSVRSDLYSLAVTLHHLLTGAVPPSAVDRVTDTMSGEADPLRPLHEINAQIPAVVSEVIQRAAALNPNERYATAAEMRAALRRVSEPDPVPITVKLPDQPPEPAMIESPLLPTERVEFVPDAQRVEAPTIAHQQLPTEVRAAGRVQIDLASTPTKQPEIKQRRRLAALTGGALILAIGMLVAISSRHLFSSGPTTLARRSPDPSPSITAPTMTPSPNVTPTPTLLSFNLHLGNGVVLEMVHVPGGEFLMGSPSNEEGRDDDEGPQHLVNIPAFVIGKYEITNAQWKAVMGKFPTTRFSRKDDFPVEEVSWRDAREFCHKLSQTSGHPFRLPTEAEWEYACRAGTITPFAFGASLSSVQANFDGNRPYGGAQKGAYLGRSTRVGSFAPNAFGLFDMHGNVYEWCEDVYHDSYGGQNGTPPNDGSAWLTGGKKQFRVLRGGSWFNFGRFCRSASRYWPEPGDIDDVFGLRVVVSARN